jgi:CRISPR/Cas system-associated protein Cas7 (RAMP superfamily)
MFVTTKYNVGLLVYFEEHEDINIAIEREKRLQAVIKLLFYLLSETLSAMHYRAAREHLCNSPSRWV